MEKNELERLADRKLRLEVEEGLGSGDLDLVAREAAARGRKANAALARPPTLAAKESDAGRR